MKYYRYWLNYLFCITAMITPGQLCAMGPGIDPVPQPSGFPGYYIGGKLGFGLIELTTVSLDQSRFSPHNNSGLAGGLYTGYRFKPYFALELGYDLFSSYYYSADINSFSNASTDVRRSLYDFDFLARVIAPFTPFYVSLSGGLALVFSSYHNAGGNGDASFGRPKLEFGMGVYVTHKISLGIAISRIFSGGNLEGNITSTGPQTYLNINPNHLPDIDLATFNVTADL